MKKKYYQYYKYIPLRCSGQAILQIFKSWKLVVFEIGNSQRSPVPSGTGRRRAGFTLVELIVYFSILSVFILILTDILVSVLGTQLSTQSTSSVVADGRYIYTRITYDINRAQSVSVPANLGDASNNLVLNIAGTTYTYALNGENLQITDPTGTYSLNGPDTKLSNLQFKRVGNISGKHTFQFTFTIVGTILLPGGRIDSEAFQTTAGLR